MECTYLLFLNRLYVYNVPKCCFIILFIFVVVSVMDCEVIGLMLLVFYVNGRKRCF